MEFGRRQELYRCRHQDLLQRELGYLSPSAFAHRIGGSQDLIQRLELYGKLDAHEGCVNTVHFNPTGELLVSGSDDRDIIFWDWAARIKKISYSSGHESNVFQAKIMPHSEDRCVVSCAADGQVRYAQILENGSVETKKLAKHHGRAHKLAIEPGSPRIFYSCGEDGAVRHFDLRSNDNTRLFTCRGFPSGTKSRHCPVVRLNAIAINPRNPHYFAVGGSDEYARVYDVRKFYTDAAYIEGKPIDMFSPTHLIGSGKVHITCVAYSFQDELLVSYNDEYIYLFERDMGLGPSHKGESSENSGENSSDVTNGPQAYKGHRNAQTVKGVNFFGPNSEYIVSGSDCGHIFIWKKRGAQLVALLKGDDEIVNCLEPHPTTTVLATSGIDRNVKIWVPTARERNPLPDAEKVFMMNQFMPRQENTFLITHLLRLQRRHAYRHFILTQSNMRHRNAHSGHDNTDDLDNGNTNAESTGDEDSSEEENQCIIS